MIENTQVDTPDATGVTRVTTTIVTEHIPFDQIQREVTFKQTQIVKLTSDVTASQVILAKPEVVAILDKVAPLETPIKEVPIDPILSK